MPKVRGQRPLTLTLPDTPADALLALSPDGQPGTSKPSVAVVVVTYNSAEHIDDCLGSVVAQLPDANSFVLVFDNASADDTADLVEQRWPGVRVERSRVNLGFARACNQAVSGLQPQFVLLVNPDAVLQPGCIAALLDAARRHPGAGLYGGRSFTPDGEVDVNSCFGRPRLWNTFCYATGLSTIFSRSSWLNAEGMGAWLRDTERPVGVLSGLLLLVDRLAWERLGGFDEDFFMYGEDVDLSVRAARLRYTPMITPAARVVHIGGASSSPVNRQILLYRGKITLARKIWTGPRRWTGERLIVGGVLLRALLAGLRAPSAASTRTEPATWAELWRRRREWRGGWTA
jgi:N-acetylglucosaminyl-diphospho-decaprenol L-rhamnosyltransferase